MVEKLLNQFFPGKKFYQSWTFWGIFLYGAVHGGLSDAIANGYVEVTPVLTMIDNVAAKSGILFTVLGIRKAAGS